MHERSLLSGLLLVVGFLACNPVQANTLQRNHGKPNLTSLWTDENGSYEREKGMLVTVAQLKSVLNKGAEINTAPIKSRWNPEFTQPLCAAAVSGNVACVKFLVSRGANVNGTDADGTTVLLRAFESGNFACVKFLVSRGAHLNRKSGELNAAFFTAARLGSVDCLKFLVKNGADIHTRQTGYWACSAFTYAASSRNADFVRYFLSMGFDVNEKDAQGETPLMDAARTGGLGCMKVLLSHGADVNANDNYGNTALMFSINYIQNADCTKLLIASGANVNARSSDGDEALSRAAWRGWPEFIRILIAAGADVNVIGNDRRAAIVDAASSGSFMCVKLLADAGAVLTTEEVNGNNYRDIRNMVLAAACHSANRAMFKYLADRGADSDPNNEYGWTPLMQAAIDGDLLKVTTLITQGVNINAATLDGETALTQAQREGYPAVVRALKAARAK
jgi:ankyrin repeat protein